MQRSAGILMYRRRRLGLEVLLAHPGGPYWARKDAGAWSIPKGEYEEGEDALEAAKREFAEELGAEATGEPLPLGEVRQKGGKRVTAWAVEGDLDATAVNSNTFEMEWPPRSGQRRTFPEVDRVEWFSVDAAREKLNPAQHAFLDRIVERLRGSDVERDPG
jgi:predicted NUDIX family NTP pyrophosphohydrolase